MIPDNLPLLPPHQRTAHQLLSLSTLPINPSPRIKIHSWFTRDLPFPRRKVFVAVYGQRFDVQVVEVGKGFRVCLFDFVVGGYLRAGCTLGGELVSVLRDGLRVVGRTEVGVDEVGGVVEFHHRFWFPASVCDDVLL